MKTESKSEQFEALVATAHEVGRKLAHKMADDKSRFVLTWEQNCPEAKAGYRAMFRYFLKHAKKL
jgi:hypothetical protein